jgi:hypothetical protein
MYLIHNTTSDSLKNILKDGYLKSYSLLKKEDPNAMPNEGDGIYTENNFVFFSCVDELFNYKINSSIILYFNSKLLFNRTFYVANHHTPKPEPEPEPNNLKKQDNLKELDNLKKWKENGVQHYKQKYDRYYEKYNDVLKKLFNYSKSLLPDAASFQAFQQIALSNKVNLKELICIEFKDKNDATPDIIKYINKYYPNVEIKIRPKL